PKVCAVIARLHAKSPADRFGTAQEVADLLGHCLEELRGDGRVRSVSGDTLCLEGRKRRWRWPWLTGGILSLAAIALLGLWLGRPGGEADRPGPEAKQPRALPPEFRNGLGMEFVLVPRGKFWMGGGKGRLGEQEVEIKDDFYLGKYEVTQGEWEAVMGNNPS